MSKPSKDTPGALVGQAAREKFEPTTLSIMPNEDVTRISLLRHGEVESFDRRIVRGQLDAALTLRGREQSELVTDWFARALPEQDVLFSSDLSRCGFLARLLEERTGLPVQSDARLREQSMGDWQGRTWDEITAEDGARVTAYWDNYVETTPPNGESLRDLQARVRGWWDEVHAVHAGKHITIVTHIGVIRSLLCSLLDIPLGDALRFAPAVGSYTSLLVSAAGTVVESFGERPWMWSNQSVGSTKPALRIALSGSAGTGKTTLGRALADQLGIPFIEEGMRARLEKGLDIHTLDVRGLRSLVRELWLEQREAQEAAGEAFIVDRSSLDYAAFWLHYNLYEEHAQTDEFFAELRASTEHYDRILLFPWGALPIEADGVRATNQWLQLRFQTILEGLLDRYAAGAQVSRVPAASDFDERLRVVLGSLSS